MTIIQLKFSWTLRLFLVIISAWCIISGMFLDECSAHEDLGQVAESSDEEAKNTTNTTRNEQLNKVVKGVLVVAGVCLLFYLSCRLGFYLGSDGGATGGAAAAATETITQAAATETITQAAATETITQAAASTFPGIPVESATARNAARFIAFNRFFDEHGRFPKMSELGLGEFEADE